MSPETPSLPTWDALALLAKLRSGGDERQAYVDEAYRRVFAGDLGRFVLLHHLQSCGVGRRSGHAASIGELRYSSGMQDAAIQLANDAGYDEAALAAVLLTNDLPEEPSDARRTDSLDYIPDSSDDF